MKRLWEAYETLQKLEAPAFDTDIDMALNEKIKKLLLELDDFMNDDFNTAKVLANLFEIVPVINAIKNKQLSSGLISSEIFTLMQKYFKLYLENILGLRTENTDKDGRLNTVLGLLMDLRKDAKSKKDYSTSDKIRTHLKEAGILLKDEKDGSISYSIE